MFAVQDARHRQRESAQHHRHRHPEDKGDNLHSLDLSESIAKIFDGVCEDFNTVMIDVSSNSANNLLRSKPSFCDGR
jgi:hypothetical protein